LYLSADSDSHELAPYRYTKALKDQPTFNLLPAPYDIIIPAILVTVGQTLVLSSTWQLGITGTFLGDYFGILLDEVCFLALALSPIVDSSFRLLQKVEAFPFNILSDPMYVGSALTFAGGALWYV
jgi:phosphatidylethanolamine N-methyltransferase